MHTWTQALAAEKQQPYFRHILDTVRAERAAGQTIYPPAADVFNAFKATEFSTVKAVILGQDPYHGAGQAHGLAFSVRPNIPVPPSLQNIYKELADDLPGFTIPTHGCLQHWAEQGVLLLNTVLTVRAGQAHSHAALGWETFTDTVIRRLAQEREHLVFILWGSHAQKKGAFI
ncbi:TPA: uracil-DNA glycosylase, partial [Neisseria bacilliformis]